MKDYENDCLSELDENILYLLNSDSYLNVNVRFLLEKVDLLSKDITQIKIKLKDIEKRKGEK